MAALSKTVQAIEPDNSVSRDLQALSQAMAEQPHERQARILDMIVGSEPLDAIFSELGCFVEQQIPGSRCLFSLRAPAVSRKSLGKLQLDGIGLNSGNASHRHALHTAVRLAELAIERCELLAEVNRQTSFDDQERNDGARERRQLESDLAHAVRRGELQLYYQPQVDLDERLVGMEALLRWNHSTLGLLGPDRFVGIAEETSLIVPIGEWVMQEACRQCAEWNRSIKAPVKVGVNVSALQLYFSDLPQIVAESLRNAGLPPVCLEVELTETTLMRNIDASARSLQKLRDLGVTIAIDDFGAGYSSLRYVEKLPIDRLKIDRSFLQHIQTAPSAAIVRTITSLGHSLGLRVIAEGVETPFQMETIRQIGVDVAQGFLIARPMPADRALDWMARPGVRGCC